MKLAYYAALSFSLIASVNALAQDQPTKKTPESSEIWDLVPRLVTPGEKPGDAPADAIVLFDGKNLDQWTSIDGSQAKWPIKDGAVTVLPGGKDIKTKLEFSDFQLHIEFRTPVDVDPKATGQGRGNSGIFLHERYELQVLDNYNNVTYSNGQAGSIYKQTPPLVNVCRKPGEWQIYEVIFNAPHFNKEGRVISPARVTVLQNGVVVQNNTNIWGPTEYIGLPVYKGVEKGGIKLQDHGNLDSFRNIWVREL